MILVMERRECFCHSGTVAARTRTFSAGSWGDRREELVELVKRKEKPKLELWRYLMGTTAWGGSGTGALVPLRVRKSRVCRVGAKQGLGGAGLENSGSL